MATRVYSNHILEIEEVATETRLFRLTRPPELEFVPGQFISCLLDVGGEPLTKPYTITSDPESTDRLEICLNRITGGAASSYLFDLTPGAELRFTGPWGTFTLDSPPARECIFVGGGTGIAAIRPMLRRALRGAPSVPLALWQCADGISPALFEAELEMLAADHPRFRYHLIETGLLDVVSARYIDADGERRRDFYICGIGEMVPQLRDRLRQAGYERRAVHYEKW